MKIVYLESNEYLVLSNLNFARSYRSSSTLNSVFLSLQTSGDRAAKMNERSLPSSLLGLRCRP